MSLDVRSMKDALAGNAYPGRGIVIGKSADGKKAIFAYFIMGRSNNSRNRVFVEEGDCVATQPFDVSKVEDPSLIGRKGYYRNERRSDGYDRRGVKGG